MEPEVVDLRAIGQTTGPQWGTATSELNATLLSWNAGQEVATHVNSEVDVVMVVIQGSGTVTLDGASHDLREGQAVVIPKGIERGIRATSTPFVYLNVHRKRSLQLTSPPVRR